jgi:hypothetical protein
MLLTVQMICLVASQWYCLELPMSDFQDADSNCSAGFIFDSQPTQTQTTTPIHLTSAPKFLKTWKSPKSTVYLLQVMNKFTTRYALSTDGRFTPQTRASIIPICDPVLVRLQNHTKLSSQKAHHSKSMAIGLVGRSGRLEWVSTIVKA